jgi:hypothetical protein
MADLVQHWLSLANSVEATRRTAPTNSAIFSGSLSDALESPFFQCLNMTRLELFRSNKGHIDHPLHLLITPPAPSPPADSSGPDTDRLKHLRFPVPAPERVAIGYNYAL